MRANWTISFMAGSLIAVGSCIAGNLETERDSVTGSSGTRTETDNGESENSSSDDSSDGRVMPEDADEAYSIVRGAYRAWEIHRRDKSLESSPKSEDLYRQFVRELQLAHDAGFHDCAASWARRVIKDRQSGFAEEGRRILEAVAISGNARAMFLLAELHLEGTFTNSSVVEAEALLRRAAGLGYSNAFSRLSRELKSGEHLQQDLLASFHWLKVLEEACYKRRGGDLGFIDRESCRTTFDPRFAVYPEEVRREGMPRWVRNLESRIAGGDVFAAAMMCRTIVFDGVPMENYSSDQLDQFAEALFRSNRGRSRLPYYSQEARHVAARMATYFHEEVRPYNPERVAFYGCIAQVDFSLNSPPKNAVLIDAGESLRNTAEHESFLPPEKWAEMKESVGVDQLTHVRKQLREAHLRSKESEQEWLDAYQIELDSSTRDVTSER